MKFVKIGAIWCSGCIVMNKVFNKLKSDYNLDIHELDLDMDEDEVKQYGKFDVLPVFIVFDGDKEVLKIVGEKKLDDVVELLKGVGAL